MIDQTPELSLDVPCNNELTSIMHTVSGIVNEFENDSINMHLMFVDNGFTWKFEWIICQRHYLSQNSVV